MTEKKLSGEVYYPNEGTIEKSQVKDHSEWDKKVVSSPASNWLMNSGHILAMKLDPLPNLKKLSL
ncbi:MAG: hypothetical protein ABR597_00030 [Bacteroidales bacterium]